MQHLAHVHAVAVAFGAREERGRWLFRRLCVLRLLSQVFRKGRLRQIVLMQL